MLEIMLGGDSPNGRMYEVEVVLDGKNGDLYAACAGLARKYGARKSSNHDLTGVEDNGNSFHLFDGAIGAEAFRTEIINSGLSRAVHIAAIQKPKTKL